MAISEQVQGGPAGLLSGLVHGYLGAQADKAQSDLATRVSQQKQLAQYFHEMATNPNVPPEHQQWAMQQGLQLAQHDISKPFPKGLGDLSKLPPVNIQQAPRQAVSQAPAMQLQMPTPPGGGGQLSTPQAQAPSTSEVGRSSNGTVNALGQAPALQMPEPPPNLGAVAPSSVNIPAGPPNIIQNPTPPKQIAPGGALHLLTPEDRLAQATVLQQTEMNQLQQQYPTKSPEELSYFAQHGEFPKPQYGKVGPGEALVQETPQGAKEVYRNTEPKPGAKSGYKFDKDTGGITDLSHGGVMTVEEVANEPKARDVLEQASRNEANKEARAMAKEVREHQFRMSMAAQSHEYQAEMLDARQEALTSTNQTMVQKAPKVQGLVEKVRRDMQDVDTGPFAGRWQELWAGKIGADDPAFTKLRTDAGLLQTALMQMHTGSRGSQQMLKHFHEMLDTGKQSSGNLHAALDSINDYATDIKQSGAESKAAVATTSRGGRVIQKPTPPPGQDGAGLSAQARARLEENHRTVFANGQVWTLKNGQPTQIQ